MQAVSSGSTAVRRPVKNLRELLPAKKPTIWKINWFEPNIPTALISEAIMQTANATHLKTLLLTYLPKAQVKSVPVLPRADKVQSGNAV